jgi:hypothetical protein
MSEAKRLSQITCTFSNYLLFANALKSLIPDSHGQTAADILGPASVGEGLLGAEQRNIADEMWVVYIKNQSPLEPDDNFNVTVSGQPCPPNGGRSGFKP